MPTQTGLTPRQQVMLEVWERHMRAEFEDHSADAALETMSATPHLNHVPVMTGGVGREEIRTFYATRFIPGLPPDVAIELISRTIGQDRIVDEFIACDVPAMFMGAVGAYYQDFSQTTDEEVAELLAEMRGTGER